jgi:hypothetical protein
MAGVMNESDEEANELNALILEDEIDGQNTINLNGKCKVSALFFFSIHTVLHFM